MRRFILTLLGLLLGLGLSAQPTLEQEYAARGIPLQYQGSQPTCWAYAFVGALELAVARQEGRVVTFDPAEFVAMAEQTTASQSEVTVALGKGGNVELALWQVWHTGLLGSDGRRYRNIFITLAPDATPLRLRLPTTHEFAYDRLRTAQTSGWVQGNRLWLRQQVERQQPVVCTLLGWRDTEPNYMNGHAAVALGLEPELDGYAVRLRNSWQHEPLLALGAAEAHGSLFAEYTVWLGTDRDREQWCQLVKAAGAACRYFEPVPIVAGQYEELDLAR